jgi:hypothetical protein
VRRPAADQRHSRFRDGVDWSRPDAADQANALARAAVLHLVQAYRDGGNEALGEYRDNSIPRVSPFSSKR